MTNGEKLIKAGDLLGDAVVEITNFEDYTIKIKKEILSLLASHEKNYKLTYKKIDNIFEKFDNIDVVFDDDVTEKEIDTAEKRFNDLADAFEEAWHIFFKFEEIEIYD